MYNRNLKPHETEGIVWGFIAAITLGVGDAPPVFSVVVGVIFVIVAVFVLEPEWIKMKTVYPCDIS